MRVITVILLAFLAYSNAQDLVVTIPQGSLRGFVDIDRIGNEFYSFMNIPYAVPPLGDLRFRAPIPAGNWEGIREVNNVIPACVQCGFGGCPGTEDCLYLNVYTPQFPNQNNTLKPVMVDIHGGAFTGGSAGDGPHFLITKDVIVATINYRLGIFGSFSVDDPELGVPGNAGMKDQSLAIKWIHDNIRYFGGDPNNIMIFGDSAGAASVHLQVLSPMSKGIFQKALCQSGVALFDLMNGVRNNGILMAQQLGIQTQNLSEMLNSLQQIPAFDILLAEQALTGASHTDEKAHLFRFGNTPDIQPGSVEEQALERLVTLWTNFAKYSTPTTQSDDVIWESITEETFKYLHFDTYQSTLQTGAPQPANMAFWEQLYDEFFPGKL
ncbi:carboxylesterase [Holotrichia oblita]|uniref:Carboxylesterase n=1 Tax=Holotrichia oblita TaxID=644536 RepID=A0ACB9T7F3_HOLOL|nr:carboxylesterase [Holotrichia oblita]